LRHIWAVFIDSTAEEAGINTDTQEDIMKRTSMSVATSGRLVVVSLLAAGFLLAGNSPSWADRDGRRDRQENRYEQRHDNWKDSRHDNRHDSRFEKRGDHRKHKVTVIRELPRGYRTVVVNRTPYYIHEHRYYSRVHNGYALVGPPVGAVFATLPFGSISVNIGGNFFYRTEDVYYRPTPRGYVVVDPRSRYIADTSWYGHRR
jgi:Ni/Co efflux regulator RcnB